MNISFSFIILTSIFGVKCHLSPEKIRLSKNHFSLHIGRNIDVEYSRKRYKIVSNFIDKLNITLSTVDGKYISNKIKISVMKGEIKSSLNLKYYLSKYCFKIKIDTKLGEEGVSSRVKVYLPSISYLNIRVNLNSLTARVKYDINDQFQIYTLISSKKIGVKLRVIW